MQLNASSRKEKPSVRPRTRNGRVWAALGTHSWFKWLPPKVKVKKVKTRLKQLSRKDHSKAVNLARHPRKYRMPRSYRPPKGGHKPASPYTREWKGDTVIEDYNGSTSTISVVRTAGVYESLLSFNSVPGNHKDPTAHSWEKVTWIAGNGYQLATAGKTYTKTTGYFKPYPSKVWSPFNVSVYNSALGRLYDQLRGDIDLSIDLAETHKTRQMMAHTIRGMKNLLTTFRKMRRSNPRDWGNLWLEFTYGWKPLASTIYGAAHKLLLEPSGARYLKIRSSSKGHSDEGVTVQGGGVTDARKTQYSSRNDYCRIKCEFRLTDSRLQSLAGFTSLNPVSIAWELTPYSFVVDWFLDVGSYLRNFETACLYGSTFSRGVVQELWHGEVREVYFQNNPNAGPNGTFTLSTTGLARNTKYRRTVLSSIPFPRAPRFDPKLGSSRLISAAALLGQMVTSLEHVREGRTPNKSTDWFLRMPRRDIKGPYAWLFR